MKTKKVFSNHSEVCHVWAQQRQTEGRAGNISFNGPAILSYHWWIMARFTEIRGQKYCFVRNWNYSNSTAKHMNHMYGAITPEYKIVYMYDPGNEFNVPHPENIKDFKNKIFDTFDKFSRSRIWKEFYFRQNRMLMIDLNKYLDLFRIKSKFRKELRQIEKYILDPLKAGQEIRKQQERNAELEATKQARKDAALEECKKWMKDNIKELTETANNYIDNWRRTGKEQKFNIPAHIDKKLSFAGYNNTYWDKMRDSFILGYCQIELELKPADVDETTAHLRIKDDQIITNRGARVPLKAAKILHAALLAGRSVKGMDIGYYTVISFNGGLKIGCHTISRKEINNFCKFYNWELLPA